jgi:hypothetical protein
MSFSVHGALRRTSLTLHELAPRACVRAEKRRVWRGCRRVDDGVGGSVVAVIESDEDEAEASDDANACAEKRRLLCRSIDDSIDGSDGT